MNRSAIVVLAALCALPSARATDAQPCDAAAFKVAGRFLGVAGFDADGEASPVAAAACKPAPDQPGHLLAVFAYAVSEGGKPPPEYEKQLAVLVIDRAHGRVIASRKDTFQEDALTEVGRDSLRLDTARYQLAPGVRAFGLRFQSAARGASCADASWGDLLTLFVAEGGALRPVLALDMNATRALAGCVGSATSGSVIESATLTLEVAPTRNQGYADLVVRARIETWAVDETKKVPAPRVDWRTLRYDGKRYPLTRDWWLTNL